MDILKEGSDLEWRHVIPLSICIAVVPHTMHFEARKWKPKACVTRHSLKNSDLTDKDVVTLETSPSIPSMSGMCVSPSAEH